MALGIDYAWGRPKPSSIASSGYGFVCRYLSHDGPKNLSQAEAGALAAAGLDIVMVWESTAGRALAGAGAGSDDGHAAKVQADACGAPASAPILFAVDFDAQPSQFPAIAAYLEAARGVIAPHPVGVYGGFPVCEAMNVPYRWQTVAWSHGKVSAWAQLFQRARQVVIDGVTCDVNEALRADFGGWHSRVPIDPARVISTTHYPGEDPPVRSDVVLVPTDPQGNGWVHVPGVDPDKVLNVAPLANDPPHDTAYFGIGDWGHTRGAAGDTDVVVVGAKPNYALYARVWSLS